MKKSIFFLTFILFSNIIFCAGISESLNVLNSNNADFSTVLTGKAICSPISLADGFVLVNDAGNLVCIAENGKILWERNLHFSSNSKIHHLQNDFILVTTKNGKSVSLYNSSGIEIFTTEFSSPVLKNVLQGFDSRIYIPLENEIQCISVGGTKKWAISEEYDGDLYSLNDGSILIKNKGVLKKISPFGKIEEEISFDNEVQKIFQCRNGILIYFKEGFSAYYSVKSGKLCEIWKNDGIFTSENSGCVFPSRSEGLNSFDFAAWDFQKNSGEKNPVLYINFIDEKTGLVKTKMRLTVSNPNESGKTYAESPNLPSAEKTIRSEDGKKKNQNGISSYKFALNQNGILIIDGESALFFDRRGTPAWKKKLSENPDEIPDYIILNNSNDLFFFCPNWSINHFTVLKETNDRKNADRMIFERKDFEKNNAAMNQPALHLISPSSFLFSQNYPGLSKEFFSGNSGSDEEDYFYTVKDFFENYIASLDSSDFGTRHVPNEYETNISTSLQFINLSFSMQSDIFSRYYIRLIRNEKNPAVLKTVLKGLSLFGYDDGLKILNEMSMRAKRIGKNEEYLVPLFCDATFSICSFMGKNAFDRYGNEILRTFFSDKFSIESKKVARNTYSKLSKCFQYN